MISRYSAALNGISLESINPKILLTDIMADPPNRKVSTYMMAQRDGGRITRNYKEKASVTIRFMIREYDIAKRQVICQQICAWAKDGGKLVTNDRIGQELTCVCDQQPTISSALHWTDELSVTFTAYELPYWREVNPATLTLTGSTGSGAIYIPGSAPGTVMEVSVTAKATITSLSFTVGDTTMQLTGLNIANGATVEISYDEHMIQSIKTGTTSLLNKRTGADDLVARCGASNTVSYTASGNCDVTFRGKGLWE